MGIDPDPYRTLGLSAGASADEIRRAYRRLAKANHPDSAGEVALPRFLAIQAAYEALANPTKSRRPGGRPTGARPTPPSESWRADPDRARASREAGGRRWNRAGAGPTDGSAPSDGTRTRRRPAADDARPPGPDRARRSSGRKRPPNKATLGSTSYDAADDEPFEPEWTGGTWYGASSGTYWTINPKEYADPRKHGPEYQRRARRRAEAGASPGFGGDPAFPSGAASDDDGWAADPAGEPSSSAAAENPTAGPPGGSIDPVSAAAEAAARGLVTPPRTFVSRLGLALVGWPPLGIAFATIAGEATGCGRFAAGCIEIFGVGTWLVQVVIIVLLLAFPPLAAVSAAGTVAALAASIPTAIVLSATGGANEPLASASILGAVLAIAYLAGVAFALLRRRRPAPLP